MAQTQRDCKRARVRTWKVAALDDAAASGERSASPAAAPPPQQQAAAGSVSCRAPSSEPPEACIIAASAFPLAQLPRDLLPQVLSHLDSPDLLRMSQVSPGFAAACEECFRGRCGEHGWRFPRLPRGENAATKQYPWRSLYRQHACVACGNVGDFPCRRGVALNSSCLFLLCKWCAHQPDVQRRLVAGNLRVDLFGLSGRKLLKAAAMKREGGVLKTLSGMEERRRRLR